MCPPGPVTRTVILSQAAVIAPTRVPTLPTSSRGSQCSAKTRSTDAMPPAASTSSAPHGTSSAGWKISLTRPGSAPAADIRARTSPVPSSTVVCTSCPQAWQALATVDRYGTFFSSLIGSASMSARRPTTGSVPAPMSTSRPVPLGSTTGRRPAASSLSLIRRVVRNS